MANINYGAGCHQCNPVGAVKYSSKPYILHHFRDIHPDRAVSKAKLTAQRMSQTNKRNGWGFQNNRTEKEIRDDFERLRREARSQTVPVRREINHSNYFPHFYTKIQGWFNYQELYHEIVKELPDNSHIVELGAWKGCSTAFLAVEIINSGKNIKLDVVDTWKGSIDEIGHQTDPDMIKYNGDIFPLFMENIDPVKHVINPIQLPTEEAYKLYADKSLDFVFLDANHSYACVKEDIKNWLPKVKAGGVFAGHDWNHISWPGVVQAVKESFALDKIIVIGECWVIQL
jgi:cephalosporin hydroxylase